MGFLEKLQERWNLKSLTQVVIVLIVFGLTGTTVLILKRPVVSFFTTDGEQDLWFSVAYYILILPIYNVILLFYGFVFGQFQFFWGFEKKTFDRIFRRKPRD